MKRTIISLGLIVSAIALTDCTKNEENIISDNQRHQFELYVSPSTRTAVNADDNLLTDWVAGDAITVLHRATGEYVNDGAFTIADEDLAAGRFTGTLGGTIAPDDYNMWYALYPHKTANASAAEPTDLVVTVKQSQTQTGSGRNHICGENAPLLGMVNVAPGGGSPSIVMKHLTTLLKVVVSNPTDEAITVKTVKFGTSVQKISGTFKVKDSSTIIPQADSYNNSTLTVTGGGQIAAGGSAEFFLTVAPFTAAAAEVLTVMVILDDSRTGTVEKTLTAETAFAAGKVNTLNVDFTPDAKYYRRCQTRTGGKILITSIAPKILVMNVSTETPKAPADDLGVYYDSDQDRFVSTAITDSYYINCILTSGDKNPFTFQTQSDKFIGAYVNGLVYGTWAGFDSSEYRFRMNLNANYESSSSLTFDIQNYWNYNTGHSIKWNAEDRTFGTGGTKGVRIYRLNE